MKFFLEPELFKKIKEITKKNPKLSKKIQKQVKFFSADPKHTSLNTHKLKGGLSARWSISKVDPFVNTVKRQNLD